MTAVPNAADMPGAARVPSAPEVPDVPDAPDAASVLLSGIVGSTAYGLAHAGSDTDRLGLFAVPTERLHGLHPPKESYVSTDPDRTLHEAAKWCRLALGGNPTVTELVWLPDELYEVRTPLGDELIGIRATLLSAHRVRAAYLGYATRQFRRLRAKDPRERGARVAKHARHLKRLCHQGLELYTTGRLTLRVEDPQEYRDFGERVAADPEAALPLLRHYEAAFGTSATVLPDEPDEAAAEAWLRRVRERCWTACATG
ncbi:nucleotidyltransferase domain-containing protein [Streptomyces sp. NPDC047000]|uniref:nucleotidyltransferase domain-containing protein n=1 Tax=Streptomyces sp. NPDC047000 TaxID=3155474 RepID=UPI0033C7B229